MDSSKITLLNPDSAPKRKRPMVAPGPEMFKEKEQGDILKKISEIMAMYKVKPEAPELKVKSDETLDMIEAIVNDVNGAVLGSGRKRNYEATGVYKKLKKLVEEYLQRHPESKPVIDIIKTLDHKIKEQLLIDINSMRPEAPKRKKPVVAEPVKL